MKNNPFCTAWAQDGLFFRQTARTEKMRFVKNAEMLYLQGKTDRIPSQKGRKCDMIMYKYKDIIKTPLKQNGDFRSPEAVEILKEADIVVTNPPFSLFREYVAQLVEYNKQFDERERALQEEEMKGKKKRAKKPPRILNEETDKE